jgi:exodeoxyribonuclease-5
MSQCQILEAVKYLEDLYEAADSKEAKVALSRIFNEYNEKRTDIQKKVTFAGYDPINIHGKKAPITKVTQAAPAAATKVQGTYEVSTAGDKRFSALVARLKDGRTIEEAYQLDVKGYRDPSKKNQSWKDGKGKPPKTKMTQQESFDAYFGLWKQWAKENPLLIEELREASEGKVLTDKFVSKNAIVNQAEVLSLILTDTAFDSDWPAVVEAAKKSPVVTTTEETRITDTSSLINTKQPLVQVLKELFTLNKKMAFDVFGEATSFVISNKKERGGNFNRKTNTLTLFGEVRDNEATAHELIHSLQGAMTLDQLTDTSKAFIERTRALFKNLEAGIDENTYNNVSKMIREGNIEEGIFRDVLERVYLTMIARNEYREETVEQSQERFGREFTAIVGSSPAFRKAMYGNLKEDQKIPFKMTIQDIVRAIKNVKELIKKIIKDDPEELAQNEDYISALKVLDEYINYTGPTEPTEAAIDAKPEPAKEGEDYTISGNMKTNPGQTAAIDSMKDWYNSNTSNTFMLQGRGGTGKTTVINVLLKELGINASDVVFAAPTNKAVKVLKEANKSNDYANSEYATVAQLLGIKPKRDKDGNQTFSIDEFAKPTPMERIVIVDEASMLHSDNYTELLIKAEEAGAKLIFMGDNAQLPPIGDKKAPVSSVVFDENKDTTAKLNELMRQKEGSPIIAFTDKIIGMVNVVEKNLTRSSDLEGKTNEAALGVLFKGEKFNNFNKGTNEGLLLTDDSFDAVLPSFLEDYKNDPKKTKVITYNAHTHVNSIRMTNKVRTAIFGNAATTEFIKGEPLILNGPVTAQDSKKNNINLDNGEEFTVVSSKIVDKNITYKVGKKVITSIEKIKVYEITATDNVTGDTVVFNKPAGSAADVDAFINSEKQNVMRYGFKPGAAYNVDQVLAQSLSYGYVINTYRSQGSTYNTVYADLGNMMGQTMPSINAKVKSLYVAASRPRKKLVVMDTRPSATNQLETPAKMVNNMPTPAAFSGNSGEVSGIIDKVNKCKGS